MHLLLFVIILFTQLRNTDSAPAHAFYISVIEINHNANSKEADLTIKVFEDDLRDALRNASKSKEPIDALLLCTEHKSEVSDYFDAHLSVYLNESSVPVNFNSCENVGDTYQLSFSMECPAQWYELNISADFLMELFPTQSQMVHITHNEETVTMRLTAKRKSQTISF